MTLNQILDELHEINTLIKHSEYLCGDAQAMFYLNKVANKITLISNELGKKHEKMPEITINDSSLNEGETLVEATRIFRGKRIGIKFKFDKDKPIRDDIGMAMQEALDGYESDYMDFEARND